jgi:hypothetical protein
VELSVEPHWKRAGIEDVVAFTQDWLSGAVLSRSTPTAWSSSSTIRRCASGSARRRSSALGCRVQVSDQQARTRLIIETNVGRTAP